MVALADDREAVALEALDQPQLPERLRAVELLGEDPRGEVAQLLLGAGRGQGGLADVVVEVQVGVVDPDRAPLAERDEAKLLAEPRDEVEARLDVVAELVVGRRRAVEDDRRGDVHVGTAALHVEECGVEAGEAIRAHGLIFACRDTCVMSQCDPAHARNPAVPLRCRVHQAIHLPSFTAGRRNGPAA